jgi:hypothetical protein
MGAYGAALIAGSIREVTMSPRGGIDADESIELTG